MSESYPIIFHGLGEVHRLLCSQVMNPDAHACEQLYPVKSLYASNFIISSDQQKTHAAFYEKPGLLLGCWDNGHRPIAIYTSEYERGFGMTI